MKSNYLNKQLKQFLSVTALFMGIMAITTLSHAGDRAGNGGSGNESDLAAQQAQLEMISQKTKNFFRKNADSLQQEFPEFQVSELIQKLQSTQIRVVNNVLTDRHGIVRTCLNFSSSDLIECNSAEIAKIEENAKALFVLNLHEHLGLLGVEETSPKNPQIIDGYSISKRIAPYVTKVSDFDLVKESSCNLGVKENISPKSASVLVSKGYNLIPLSDAKSNDFVLSFKSGRESRALSGLFCRTSYVDITLLKKGTFNVEIKKVQISECSSLSSVISNYEKKEAKALEKLPACK